MIVLVVVSEDGEEEGEEQRLFNDHLYMFVRSYRTYYITHAGSCSTRLWYYHRRERLMLATLFFFFFDVFVFVDDSTSSLLLLTNFMNSYVTHNFPPNVIGFINALSVKLSANATVNRVGSAFANIGILLTAERAGPLELSSIFTNTGCTFFLIASMFAKGWQIVLDGWIPYAATHVDAAKVMEKTSWNLSRKTREREGRAHKNPRVSSQFVEHNS